MHHTHRVTAYVLALLACAACAACSSSSSGGSSASTSAFIGTWQYTGATETDTCGGQSSTETITGTFQFQEGTMPGTIEYIGTGGCTFTLDVSGNTATAVAGSMCTQTSGSTTSVSTLTTYTATLNGTTLTINDSSSVMLNENGASEDCTGVRTGTLTQIAK
jgi:hypothetical protein